MSLPTTTMLAQITQAGSPTVELLFADGWYMEEGQRYDILDVVVHRDPCCRDGVEEFPRAWLTDPVTRRLLTCITCAEDWDLWRDVELLMPAHIHTGDLQRAAAGHLAQRSRSEAVRYLCAALEYLHVSRYYPKLDDVADSRHREWFTSDAATLVARQVELRAAFRALWREPSAGLEHLVYVSEVDVTLAEGCPPEAADLLAGAQFVHVTRPVGAEQTGWALVSVPPLDLSVVTEMAPVVAVVDLGPAQVGDGVELWSTLAALVDATSHVGTGDTSVTGPELVSAARAITA
jgi:hypothetical protein